MKRTLLLLPAALLVLAFLSWLGGSRSRTPVEPGSGVDLEEEATEQPRLAELAGGDGRALARSGGAPAEEELPAPGSFLAFRVQRLHDRAPIAGASVSVVGAGGAERLPGQTDEEGLLRTSIPSEAEGSPDYLTVLARREGFAPRLCNVGYRRSGTVIIGMVPAGVLRGTVVDVRGNVVSGARIVAFPSAYPISGPEGVERIRRGAHPGAFAEADSEGAFELRDLAAGEGHIVAAASAVGFSEEVGGLPGGEDLVLVTRELVGCYVRIELGDGRPLPQVTMSPSTGVGLWTNWRGAPAEPLAIDFTRRPVVPPFQFGLLPLAPEALFERCYPEVPGVFLCIGLLNHVVTGEPPTVSLRGRWPILGPFEVQARLETWMPGFPTQVTRLPFERFETGTLVLDLRTDGDLYPGGACPSTVELLTLMVELENLEEGDKEDYGLDDLSAPPRLIVPCGRYGVTISPNGSSSRRWPMVGGDRLVDILPGEETHVAVLAPDLGELAFDVRRDDGTSVDGKLSLFLRHVDGDEAQGLEWVSFRRPPYCLPRVSVGSYEIHKLRSHRVDALMVEPQTFQVVEGALTRVELVLVGGE